MKIEPTPGRMCWFIAREGDTLFSPNHDAPLSAQVAFVHADGRINAQVLDRDGNAHARQGVVLVQDGADTPATDSFCIWMPYQVGQAKKDAVSSSKGPDLSQGTGDVEKAKPDDAVSA